LSGRAFMSGLAASSDHVTVCWKPVLTKKWVTSSVWIIHRIRSIILAAIRLRNALPNRYGGLVGTFYVSWAWTLTTGQFMSSGECGDLHSNCWSSVYPEDLKKVFPTFYGTSRFITVFTKAHQNLSWARWIQSSHFNPISLRFILIFSHLCRGLSSELFLSFRLSKQNLVRVSFFPHACYMPRQSRSFNSSLTVDLF
jgi:hypothetical protein